MQDRDLIVCCLSESASVPLTVFGGDADPLGLLMAAPAPPATGTVPPDLDALRAKIKAAFDLFDKDGRGTIVEECVPG
jgi:hypothetical protein